MSQNEIDHERATVTTVTDKVSDRESKSDREREGGGGVRGEQRQRPPFFAVNVAPCIRVYSKLSQLEHRLPRV